jgi:hypothetical protein
MNTGILKLVAIIGVVVVAAIGCGSWMVLGDLAKAHQGDHAKLVGGECSTLLRHLESTEIPGGHSQGEVAFCLREGYFSIDDLNSAGRGDLVKRLQDVGLIEPSAERKN